MDNIFQAVLLLFVLLKPYGCSSSHSSSDQLSSCVVQTCRICGLKSLTVVEVMTRMEGN